MTAAIVSTCRRCAACAIIAVVYCAVGGCYFLAAPTTPIPTLEQPAGAQPSGSLVVMLPGFGDRADRFFDSGFIGSVAEPAYDIVSVDAHFAYYRNRTLVPRLANDVIGPAIANGYEDIWLVGVSMGGLGSLLYASAHAEEITGVVLMAPWLGDAAAVREVRASGGLQQWDGELADVEDYQRDVWRFLQSAAKSGKPRIVIAYGDDDAAAVSGAVVADALPESQTFVTDGGHDWTTWVGLWQRINAAESF